MSTADGGLISNSKRGASTIEKPNDVVIQMHGGGSTCKRVENGEKQEGAAVVNGTDGGSHGEGDGEKDEWVRFIVEKINAHTEARSISIPRAPERSHHQRRYDEAFEPHLVSIGPYHRDKPRIQALENDKWKRLKDIVDKRKKDVLDQKRETVLNGYFKELKKLEDRAKSFYSDDINLSSRNFLTMLLLDGCFIVDFLCGDLPKHKVWMRRPIMNDLLRGDLPKHKVWMQRPIMNDLLLLDNQLPFFILQHIYRLVRDKKDTQGFRHLALEFCRVVCPQNKRQDFPSLKTGDFQHLLHFYHSFLFAEDGVEWRPVATEKQTMPTASALKEAGIKFKKMNVRDHVFDVSFDHSVMSITPMVIDAYEISLFRNLTAFEELNPYIEPRFTAFSAFMNSIVDTSKDVALLQKKGIIKHAFGSDKEVATILNQLTSGTFRSLPRGLERIYEKVGDHCNTKSNYWWASLWREYFGSPWTTISILAVVIFLSFAFIQAFFSVYAYFKPPSPSPSPSARQP